MEDGRGDGTLLNEGDTVKVTLGAPLAAGIELGPDDGTLMTLGLDEGTIDE
jgi:hypothetical protein